MPRQNPGEAKSCTPESAIAVMTSKVVLDLKAKIEADGKGEPAKKKAKKLSAVAQDRLRAFWEE